MSYKKFQNKDCEFYPCHNVEYINCLFCFCPLYNMDCCGNFKMIGDLKDCSDCLLPHSKIGYDYIIKMLKNNKKSIDK